DRRAWNRARALTREVLSRITRLPCSSCRSLRSKRLSADSLIFDRPAGCRDTWLVGSRRWRSRREAFRTVGCNIPPPASLGPQAGRVIYLSPSTTLRQVSNWSPVLQYASAGPPSVRYE